MNKYNVRNDVLFAALDFLSWLISAINDDKSIGNTQICLILYYLKKESFPILKGNGLSSPAHSPRELGERLLMTPDAICTLLYITADSLRVWSKNV
jgi:hypothetical protein